MDRLRTPQKSLREVFQFEHVSGSLPRGGQTCLRRQGAPSALDYGLRALARARMPGIRRVIQHVRKPDRMGAQEVYFRSQFAGLNYEGTLTEHIDREIFYFGAYSPDELDFLEVAAQRLSSGGPLAYFDVGANVGQHALWMSRRVERVIAFEPSQRAVAQFQANIAANAIANISVFPVALGAARAEANLGSGLPNNSGSRSLTWSLDNDTNETVDVYQGDDFFVERALPRMDILKLDVEGYESRVIAGLRERLLSDRPVIMMELLGPPDCKGGFVSEENLRTALPPRYRLYVLHGPRKATLRPFDWLSEEIVCLPEERVDLFRDRIA